jgi:hypothetical protein
VRIGKMGIRALMNLVSKAAVKRIVESLKTWKTVDSAKTVDSVKTVETVEIVGPVESV